MGSPKPVDTVYYVSASHSIFIMRPSRLLCHDTVARRLPSPTVRSADGNGCTAFASSARQPSDVQHRHRIESGARPQRLVPVFLSLPAPSDIWPLNGRPLHAFSVLQHCALQNSAAELPHRFLYFSCVSSFDLEFRVFVSLRTSNFGLRTSFLSLYPSALAFIASSTMLSRSHDPFPRIRLHHF